jgi:hypothetical protein
MRIKLMRTRDWQEPGDEKCSLCSQPFYLGEVSPVAVSDHDVEIGEICPACIAAGPERMEARMEARAEFSRESADEAERIAAEGVDDFPTVDDLLAAEIFYGSPAGGCG